VKAVIDRFEGNFAVCESDDRKMFNIERDSLPEGILEGCVIDICGDKVTLDKDETIKRKKEIDDLCEGLWK
jgi:hypothetical protein